MLVPSQIQDLDDGQVVSFDVPNGETRVTLKGRVQKVNLTARSDCFYDKMEYVVTITLDGLGAVTYKPENE